MTLLNSDNFENEECKSEGEDYECPVRQRSNTVPLLTILCICVLTWAHSQGYWKTTSRIGGRESGASHFLLITGKAMTTGNYIILGEK